jgi:hypothetical protein
MILENLLTVMCIALIPWLITTVFTFTLNFMDFGRILPSIALELEANSVTSALVLIIETVLFLWIVVGWHRYILLNEQPNGYFPVFHRDKLNRYFLNSLKMTVVAVIPGIAVMIVLLSIFGEDYETIPLLVMVYIFLYLSLRLGLVLPGAAVGQEITLKNSWSATSGLAKPLLYVCVFAGFPYVFLELSTAHSTSIVLDVLKHVAYGLFALYGASVLTTLYGYLVEERTL